MYDTILFDLDGTLTDPGVGITGGVAYALRKLGRPVPAREALYRYIGPPLLASFRRYAGLDEAAARQALALYREYFVPKGMFENEVYPGIPGLLAALKGAGRQVVLATSKPEPFARQILEHFDLARYFDFVAGSTLEETRTEKREVIAWALEKTHADAARAVMVGDRDYDVKGAQANGIPCIGVLFGYGTRQELVDAGAAATAEDAAALRALLLAR